MKSHVLNPTNHQTRFRPIGHKVLRLKSDSISSESSCNQNSPEYPQISVSRRQHSEDSNGDGCIQNQTINATHSSQDSTSDEESSDGSSEENIKDTQMVEITDHSDDSDGKLDNSIEVSEINVDEDDIVNQETESVHSSPLHTTQHNIDDEDNIHSSPLHTMQHKVHNEAHIDQETSSIHSSPVHNMEHSIGDEDNVDQENESVHSSPLHTIQHGPSSIDDHTLVEGDDYEIITVYIVNPEEIEPSSEDDADDYAISEKNVSINSEDHPDYVEVHYSEHSNTPCQISLDLNLDGPVVSNVDEYFIKNNNNDEDILNTDGPVVKDVDEYFIKDKETAKVPTFEDCYSKHQLPEEDSTQFKLPTCTAKIERFLAANTSIAVQEKNKLEPEPVPDTNIADVSINESDLEILPNIENIKRYLLDEIPYTKFRHNQKSCSVPQSPMQNLCMDIDDTKTCLGFEDLNLDLSDLTFDNEKDKSGSKNKSDDLPRTLTDEDINSFLITDKTDVKVIIQEEDDFSHQDMEIESTINTESTVIDMPSRKMTSTPIPRVLDFCIEKTTIKTETKDQKIELDDFVDVKSCNDTVIPVLEANNLNSLLEQFEAMEKLNTKKRPAPVVKTEDTKAKSLNKNPLTNGMRLQDAGVQLNKNKMRQILMPTPINSTVGRSKSPVHSDHDNCSSKKRHSLPNLKGGRSLLKPEVLSSNSRILNSRHRTCKSKKVVYYVSSEDETEDNKSKNKKVKQMDDIDTKKKPSVKASVKPPVQSNCRKNLSPPHSAPDSFKEKDKNNFVMIKNACKASDNRSQNSNGSIKLTIKNKSEVILNCDYIDFQKGKHIKCKNSVSDKTNNLETTEKDKTITELDRNKNKIISSIGTGTVSVKEEPRPKNENFYTTLFSNKKDVQITQALQNKIVKRPLEHEEDKCVEVTTTHKEEQPQKRKKLNLQEYKLRRGVCSNNSSAQVSPEAIFPDMPSPGLDKAVKCPITRTPPRSSLNSTDKVKNEQKFFDPIKEAARKILMNTKKQKAEATRKRDEDIVMSKIPKVENLQLQPLMSEAENLQIPQALQNKIVKRPLEHKEDKCVEVTIKKEEQPQKRKKLSLQEYKLRRGVCSNNSSAQVGPEAIFPDMPSPGLDKAVKCPITRTPPSSSLNSTDKVNNEQKFFDPIKEAARKILMNTKKQKAGATRKRDEDIVMSKIPKVENLQLQPLMSEAEMMKIGMGQAEVLNEKPIVNEKPQLSADYEKIILVSVGVNTDDNMFQKPKLCVHQETKEKSPSIDAKSLINFKIKKSDHILKQNVFDSVKRDKRSPGDDKRHCDLKIDKERYKDITATLKSVEKQVETRISSNSLFAVVQDVVMKKAPEKTDDRHSKLRSPDEKREFKFTTTIVRDYDPKAEHGEDKVILHLGKNRSKPTFSFAAVQTNAVPEFALLNSNLTKEIPVSRGRNDSDMSLSSDGSPARTKNIEPPKHRKSNERVVKSKEVRPERIEKETKEKRSRSKDRYETKYRRRSRSASRGRRRRSRSRSVSKSRGRYRRYRRSDSPYKRKRRSRSPYHKRRSPSNRRERSKISRSRSRSPRPVRPETRSKTPMMKPKPIPHTNGVDKIAPKSSSTQEVDGLRKLRFFVKVV